jgi:hypothetical protein
MQGREDDLELKEDGETRGLSAFAFEKFLLVSALPVRGLIGLIDSNLETILLWGQSIRSRGTLHWNSTRIT